MRHHLYHAVTALDTFREFHRFDFAPRIHLQLTHGRGNFSSLLQLFAVRLNSIHFSTRLQSTVGDRHFQEIESQMEYAAIEVESDHRLRPCTSRASAKRAILGLRQDRRIDLLAWGFRCAR
jgi:hypothetical protein